MKYKLGELIGAVNGYAFKRSEFIGQGIPVIKIKNIVPPVINFESVDTEYIFSENLKDFQKYQVQLGDVLISLTGSHVDQSGSMVGKVGRYCYNFPALLNQRVAKLYVKDSQKLDEDYFYFWISRPSVQKYLALNAGGSANQANISVQDIFMLDIEIPTINDQRIIASQLRKLVDKIHINEKINDNLFKLARELYRKTIVSSVLTKTKLKDFATITMGQSPSSKTYNENKVGIALLNGATDFRNGIHPSKWTTNPKRIVDKGSYIFGVRATIGLTTKVFDRYAIGRGTGSAVSKEAVNDEFLYFVLEDMFKYFASFGSGSVYINISKTDFNDYTFYKPQSNDLRRFHQTVGPIMSKIYTNKQENIVLTQLKERLLNKYF